MKIYDVCIIGGGASGLICASNLQNKNAIIIEKNEKIGKKILVTGNGRCNLTNYNLDSSKYNTKMVENYFSKFSNMDLLDYFSYLGLDTYKDDEGRVYPISNTANSVLDVLRLKIENNNIEQQCNVSINSLTKKNEYFLLKLSNGLILQAKKVVLALGGNCDLSFIKNITIPTNNYKKSLGALKTDYNKGLNNVRVPFTKVSVFTNKVKFQEIGEVFFKEDYISGIVIFNLSSHLARLNNYSTQISLDFLPNISDKSLQEKLFERRKKLSQYSCDNFLTGMFHKNLNKNLLEKCNISLNNTINTLKNEEIIRLATLIKNYYVQTYDIIDNNQVFSGGIPLNVLTNTLMFNSIPNLYAIGEMIDVDGECGGYNLQWAWTSGYICSKDL